MNSLQTQRHRHILLKRSKSGSGNRDLYHRLSRVPYNRKRLENSVLLPKGRCLLPSNSTRDWRLAARVQSGLLPTCVPIRRVLPKRHSRQRERTSKQHLVKNICPTELLVTGVKGARKTHTRQFVPPYHCELRQT